jgi:hypothetical protein
VESQVEREKEREREPRKNREIEGRKLYEDIKGGIKGRG